VQLALAADQPLEEEAEKAGALFEAGVDLV